MAGHVGKEFAASNGIIQGCLLSVLFLILLMTTAAMPKVYADDAGVFSKDSEDIDVAQKNTGCFARVTQQKLNVEKKAWSTTEQHQQEISS